MSSIKLSKILIDEAKIISKTLNRSVAQQIEHWIKIGKIVEENPDLTYAFIKDTRSQTFGGKNNVCPFSARESFICLYLTSFFSSKSR